LSSVHIPAFGFDETITTNEDTTTKKKNQTAMLSAIPSSTFNLKTQSIGQMRIIVPSVHNSIAPHIMHILDPKRVWIQLRHLYESKSMNKQLSINSQIYSLQMIDKMCIEGLVCIISDLIGQLANVGVIVQDEELFDRVLINLPSS
jgi:hypothetical protein